MIVRVLTWALEDALNLATLNRYFFPNDVIASSICRTMASRAAT